MRRKRGNHRIDGPIEHQSVWLRDMKSCGRHQKRPAANMLPTGVASEAGRRFCEVDRRPPDEPDLDPIICYRGSAIVKCRF